MNKADVQRITSQFTKKKILVFGDIGVDKYTIGRVTRISPEAPIPVVEVGNTVLKLGLAANVAENVSALGAEVVMIGVVGEDHGAHELKNLLKKSKVSTQYLVSDSERKTTMKERVVAENQQVVRIDHETQNKVSPAVLKQVWSRLKKAIDKVDAVIIEDYAKGLVEVSLVRQIISACDEKKIPVFVDPNMRSSLSLYYGCTVMTPNAAEAEALSRIKIQDQESLCQAGMRLVEEANARTVIITRGKDGMAIFNRGEAEPVLIPTFAREVFDVSGAGDTTIATLALSLVSNATLIEATLLANYAAGIVVGKRGTATTNVTEIKEYVEWLKQFQIQQKKHKKPKK